MMQSISKVTIKKDAISEVSFARRDTLAESLQTLDVKEGLPIVDALKMLSRSDVDSVSMSRDKPFCYFYARKSGDDFDIILRKEDHEIDFKIPMKELLSV